MRKIIIANAVPTNNGDAALVFGLYDKLVEKGYEVHISTTNYEVVKKIYPERNWIKCEYDFNKVIRGILKIFPKMKMKILKNKIEKNKEYKDASLIISAPGGYVNSYYGFKEKFYCLNMIKKNYGSKLIMYSQSVGPLSNKDKDILKKYMKSFDLFMVRDEISYENVKEYKNILRTNDAAFLLNYNTTKKDKKNKIAISVREWKKDGRDREQYINLIKEITIKCIKNGNKVEFISTCQGLNNYIDDSKIAKEIYSMVEKKYQNEIMVNDKFYSLDELRKYIANFKFVIGTRLHMCILSTMEGVPAFNISYEVKGKECYKILGMKEYSIDYNADIDQSLEKVQKFINNNQELENIYLKKAQEMNAEANKYFEMIVNNIIEG